MVHDPPLLEQYPGCPWPVGALALIALTPDDVIGAQTSDWVGEVPL